MKSRGRRGSRKRVLQGLTECAGVMHRRAPVRMEGLPRRERASRVVRENARRGSRRFLLAPRLDRLPWRAPIRVVACLCCVGKTGGAKNGQLGLAASCLQIQSPKASTVTANHIWLAALNSRVCAVVPGYVKTRCSAFWAPSAPARRRP